MKKILSFFTFMILFGIIMTHAADIPKVVISGIYGGGGNNGSTYKNDYIELYNTTNSSINLTGYALYYFAATGVNAGTSNTFTFPAGSTIEAHSFALVKAAAGDGTQPEWKIDFDFDGSGSTGKNLSMSASTGKILLLSAYTNFTTSGSSLPTTLAGIQALAGYMDYMPYGKNATPVFGSTTNDLSASKAASRKYNDITMTYTFNVGADFEIITADDNAPRNSSYGSGDRVATPTFSPAGGNYTNPINVTISCATAGATIRYTLDGTDPSTSSTQYTNAISVSKQTTIKAMAWKDDLEPSKIGVANYIYPVNTLAALRALAPAYNGNENAGTAVVEYIGKAVVTQKSTTGATNNLRNIYIQDGTDAIMVFDPTAKLNCEVGDRITNIRGTLTNYWGMLEIIPEVDCKVVDIDQQMPAITITASQLDYNNENPLQAKLITLKGVTYTQTGVFEPEKYYHLKEGSTVFDSIVFIENKAADFIKDAIPTTLIDITGVCDFKGGKDITTKNRIVPLNKNNNVVSIQNLNKSTIKLSPNPADNFVNIVTNSPMKLEVYSLLGNLISTESLSEGSNTISVSQYPAGMYLMKLTDSSTGQSYIQKLVVK